MIFHYCFCINIHNASTECVCDWMMDNFTTPMLPKGRGAWLGSIVNSGDMRMFEWSKDCITFGQSPAIPPWVKMWMRVLSLLLLVVTLFLFTEMVGQIGAQIGESIVFNVGVSSCRDND